MSTTNTTLNATDYTLVVASGTTSYILSFRSLFADGRMATGAKEVEIATGSSLPASTMKGHSASVFARDQVTSSDISAASLNIYARGQAIAVVDTGV